MLKVAAVDRSGPCLFENMPADILAQPRCRLSHTCVLESGWVGVCLRRCEPNGLYGMPEACRAFATSHQGMPLCISFFRGRAATFSLFVFENRKKFAREIYNWLEIILNLFLVLLITLKNV